MRLTIFRLLLLSFGIFAGFVGAAAAWTAWGPEPAPERHALRLYSERGPFAGERYLVERLQSHPESAENEILWKLLVRFRSAVDRSPHSFPGGQYLTEEKFFQFLKGSPRSFYYRKLYELCRAENPAGRVAENADPRELQALAEAQEWQGRSMEAIETYARALERASDARNDAHNGFDPGDLRRSILRLQQELGWDNAFQQSMGDPSFRNAASARQLIQYYRARFEFAQLASPIVRMRLEAYEWRITGAALLTGAAWLIFLLHAARAADWRRLPLSLAPLSVLLGVASAWATLYVLEIQESLVPLSHLPPTIPGNLVHMVLGVGLREEVLKLLCFAPLAFLLKKARDIEILTLASLTGLGFAIEENTLYYESYGGAAVLARFLTANFLHMTLTGFTGYYLTLALRSGGAAWNRFLEQFWLMVLLHGLYNFLQIDETIGEPMAAMAVHLWLAWQYLRLLRSMDRGGRRRVALSYVFAGVLAVSAGVGYLLLASEYGLWSGLWQTALGLAGVLIITVVFFREFREPAAWF